MFTKNIYRPFCAVLFMTALLFVSFVVSAESSGSDRFLDHGNGTVTDTLTGLIWTIRPLPRDEINWRDAVEACASLAASDADWLDDGSRAGDWRLPGAHELLTLTGSGLIGGALPEKHPFGDLPREAFWTQTEGVYDRTHAWNVRLFGRRGGSLSFDDKSGGGYAWPVRGHNEHLVFDRKVPDLADTFAELTDREKSRAELNALWDIRGLRLKDDFVVEHTEAFLNPPADLAEWYPTRYARAKTAPTVRLRVVPNLEPEYFPEGEAYGAGWANWASVIRSDDNRFFMAAGDHRARGCRLNLYEYRPDEGEHGVLERVLDISELLGWHIDMYTDGKIHGHWGIMPDGDLWAGTHHGPWPNEEWYEAGYRGSWLFSYNIHSGEAKNWGVPLIINSLSHFSINTRSGYFVGSGTLDDTILSWNIKEKRVQFAGYPPDGWKWWHVGILPDEETGLFWGADIGEEPYRFISFDPELNRFKRYDLEMPRHPEKGTQGYFNYFTQEPDRDGWFYCYARNGMLFKFRPGGAEGPEAEALHATAGAVGQLALCPEKRYVYYVPRRRDTMLIQQYDIKTGKVKTLGFLKEHFFRNYGLSIGNAVYGAMISADGSLLVILENGAFGRPGGFGGHPVLVVVEIPEAERITD